jgi:tRNA A-37 threonylcarbamoyl transferase component Bud32
METDATQPSTSGPHPSVAELRDPKPDVLAHVASCAMCQSVVDATDDPPIPLDLPKGLVTESAFRWPADPIARGGMAQIFLGEDRRLARAVILKAPREGEELSAGMAEMFQRRVSAEARVLAKLQHPAIVKIYELGKSTVGWPFCVLEKVDGESLRDRLDELAEREAETGKPRTRERLELLSNLVAIAEALAYAHERRVVHRDVTPNNILLGKRGEATLIDWGIARDLDAPGGSEPALDREAAAAASGKMVTITAGTPPYIPLEQSQGRRADPSFDVYSFGITLYEVVSGRTPFVWHHSSVPGQRTRQLEQFVAWLHSSQPVTPAMPRDPELSGIVARAMARDPKKRFTADQLVRALKQYLTGDLVFSHRYSLTGRLARWTRQHRAIAVTLLFVAMSIVAGALVWVQLSRAKQRDAELEAAAQSARANASEKERDAERAQREAEAAKQRADQAEREGKNADELRRDAERMRRSAESKRRSAEQAAATARGNADEAKRAQEEADRERDAANIAKAEADRQRDAAAFARDVAFKERDTARSAQSNAERDRDAAKQTAQAAESDRDAARSGQTRAEQERDASRTAQGNAEKEREAAIAARAAAERERDDARHKASELEARVRELERERARKHDEGSGGAGSGG